MRKRLQASPRREGFAGLCIDEDGMTGRETRPLHNSFHRQSGPPSSKRKAKRNAKSITENSFAYFLFRHNKRETEMNNRLCLLIIKFAQNNNQSFFCLLFFSKKSTVKEK